MPVRASTITTAWCNGLARWINDLDRQIAGSELADEATYFDIIMIN